MKSAQPGVSLVEVLLAAAIFSFLTIAFSGALVYGRTSTADAGERMRAAQLADEGVQAVTNIRNHSFGNLTNGTFGLAQAGNTWTLSGSSDTTDIFTRSVTIADNGTNRKKVTSQVNWTQGTNTATTSVVTVLTNWFANIASWLNAILGNTVDTAGTTDALKVVTAGNYAYVIRSTATAGLMVFNISNPNAITSAGSLNLSSVPTNIAISGNYLFISESGNNSELQIVNITNPTSPTIASTFDASGTTDGLAVEVSGNYAYLARAAGGGMVIVNITNPASPSLTGTYASSLGLFDVKRTGNYAFLASSSTTQEILVVNVTTPASPSLATSYNLTTSGTVQSLFISGTTLYIGHGGTLLLRGISNPLSSTAIGSIAISGATLINEIGLDSSGIYAFLATNSSTGEFRIINLTTPATPTLARTIDLTGSVSMTGLAYNSGLESVSFTSNSDTQEFGVIIRN